MIFWCEMFNPESFVVFVHVDANSGGHVGMLGATVKLLGSDVRRSSGEEGVSAAG